MGQSAQPDKDRARLELPRDGETLTIVADTISLEGETWLAQGSVILTFRDAVLEANRVSFDPQANTSSMQGDLKIRRGSQYLSATQAELDFTSDTGFLLNVDGYVDDTLYIKAKKLTKTGTYTYIAESGELTACEDRVPKWSFRSPKAHIDLESWARLQHTVFRLKQLPVLYFPFLMIPTEKKTRSSGFLLPSSGNSNNKGRRISLPFYWVLGRTSDLLFTQEYFSQRGFGIGTRIRSRPNQNSFFDVDGFWVNDRLGQGGGSVNGIGLTQLGSFRTVADFSLVTDFTFRQVFSENFFTATRPTENSRFFISNNQRNRSINFLVSQEETVFPQKNVVVRNLPRLHFGLTGERIFGSPIRLDLDASAEGLSRSDALVETADFSQRLDFAPRLYLSLPLFQGLRLTPALRLRETFYSESLTETGQEGLPDQVIGQSLNRRYFEFTLDLAGWGLSKTYKNGAGNPAFKHLIEPTLKYRLLDGIDELDSIIRFDEVDAVADTQELEYGLVNRFFVKRPRGTEEWLSVKVTQKYFLDNPIDAMRPDIINQFYPLNTLTGFGFLGSDRRFSPLTALARITPRPAFSFDVRSDYDLPTHQFRNLSLTGFLRNGPLLLSTTYFVTKRVELGTQPSHQIQGLAAFGNPARGFSFSSLFSYDIREGRFLNYRPRVNYFWDCCGVSVEYQGFNIGIREERQLRFSFFLKGIGAFGTIRRPTSIF